MMRESKSAAPDAVASQFLSSCSVSSHLPPNVCTPQPSPVSTLQNSPPVSTLQNSPPMSPSLSSPGSPFDLSVMVPSQLASLPLPCPGPALPSHSLPPLLADSASAVSYSSTASGPSSSTSIDLDKCDDIGLLLCSMPQKRIRNLPPESKYTLMVNHFRPGSTFKFPSRYLDGCNRSCQHGYLEENPWFVYSKAEEGIFCLPCVLFASKDDLGHFVCDKFNAWSRKKKKFAAHNTTQYHQLALTRADALKSSFVHPDSSIGNRMQHNISQNRYIIRCMADAILFCGKQCIAL